MTNPKGAKSARSANKRLLTLEVQLVDGLMTDDFRRRNPIVSRRIKVDRNQTLETLHDAIFDAFDREDEHLYEFEFSTGPRDPNAVKYVHPFMFDDQMPTHMRSAGDVT